MRKAVLCALAFGLSVVPGCLELSAQGTGEFHLEFRPVAEAEHYEIQFLAAPPAEGDLPGENLERFSGTTFRRMIPPDFRYFRIRAIGRYGVPGLWSAAHPVDRFLRKQTSIFRSLPATEGRPDAHYLVDQSLALSAADTEGGRSTIYFSLNDGAWQEYRGPLTFAEDGRYGLRWYAEDGVGNRAPQQSVEFFVDRTPPQVSVRFQDPPVRVGNRHFARAENAFQIAARDVLSGLGSLQCRLARNASSAFGPCPSVYRLSDFQPEPGGATYLVEFFAEDRLGNRSALRRLEIRRPAASGRTNMALVAAGFPAPAIP